MSFSGQSNPPWQRNNLNNVLQGGQIVGSSGVASIGQLSNAGLPFHQGATPQMFLQQQAQQNLNFGHEPLQSSNIFQGNASVSYPQSRSGLNPVAFQNTAGSGQLQQQSQNRSQQQQQQHYNSIGTVTKINSECGLVNEEVLFYRNVCKGHIPKLGDRVLFEASYSQNGQFKWNATRVQMMPQPGINSSQPPPLMGSGTKGSGYNAVPPPNEYQRQQQRRGASPPRRASPGRDRHARSERDRERPHRSRDKDDDEHDRKRRREDRSRTSNVVSRSDRERDRDRDDSKREHDQSRERDREREMERERERDRDKDRERSPAHRSGAKTRKTRTIRRYLVQIPKTLLTLKRADIQELRQRYSTLYIPSDFFHANIKWSDSFTHNNPFSLHRPCQFHIMHKIVEPLNEIAKDRTEPEDANYKFSAKVMLMSCPPIAELYQKCFEDDENEQHTVHPSRLISFLVGTRGRNEPMAIGGAWSPSLDGENPDKDPSVLIRTAIRTCKSLTGIDLSNCTQWYRFVELYYHRTDHKNKDKEVSPQVETVVIYLPDIHACIPTVNEWENFTQDYKAAVENVISRKQLETLKASSGGDAAGSATLANDCNKETGGTAAADTPADTEAAKKDFNTSDPDIATIAEDSKEDEEDDSPQPTHYSQLDLKAMKVQDIRNELIARNLPSKGVRNLIMARLAKALNTEKAEELNRTKDRSGADVEIIDCDSEEGVKNQTENDENSDLKNNIDDKEDEHEEHEDWADVDMNDIVILDEYDSSKNPEEGLPKEFDEREKLQLVRRYTLPNTPHVIVHPSKTAKGGKFDCSIMSLSVLLDYRPEDTKERFFEVSLFAELFNEMLMRDFGFNIYKELFLQRESNSAELDAAAEETTTNNKKDETKSIDDEEKTKDSNGPVENKQDSSNAEKKKVRRVSKQSADVDPEDDSQSIKSSADRKRKTNTNASKKKMVVVKPQLLLSFVYFDTSHCGYIFEKDLEDLFSILGLSLSRGQIRKVLGKSASRQAFYYRKLTDKEESIEALPAIEELDDIATEDVRKIALGNKQYFPIFKTEANEEDTNASGVTTTLANNDLISYNGAVIHVGKLIEQIKRTEKKFSDLEKFYNDLRKQNTDLQKEHSKSSSKIKELQSEAKGLNRKLSDTDQDLYTINRKYKDQQATLSYIYHRVSPYFNREKDHKSENSRDKDHDKHKDKDSDKSKANKEKEKSQVKEEEKERQNDDNEKNIEVEKDKPEPENDIEMNKEEDEDEEDNNVKESENEN